MTAPRTAPAAKTEIVYGKSQGPYTELFEAAIVPILEEQGYTLKGVDFSDLLTADIALNDGDVDVNVEQHTAYAENFNSNNNGDLVPISPIPTVPAGIYSGTRRKNCRPQRCLQHRSGLCPAAKDRLDHSG